MNLTIIHDAKVLDLNFRPFDPEVILRPGDTVEYQGHIPGGCVRVKLADGRFGVVHPGACEELRS
jgi:hypothetical protein